ncbi:MAG: tetratricopeptide repeat protein, partial [Chloroflexi bacterium]|nr:tetratricopeptide repeat protein [Chloroflexota bacterium]
GAILQSAPDFKNIDQALQAIDMALQLDAFSSGALKSEAFHKRGFIYEQQGVDLQDAISEYRKALDLQPDHRWARLRLGHALYFACGDAEQAEKKLSGRLC